MPEWLSLFGKLLPFVKDAIFYRLKISVPKCEPCTTKSLLTITSHIDQGLQDRLNSLLSNARVLPQMSGAQIYEAITELEESNKQAEVAFATVNEHLQTLHTFFSDYDTNTNEKQQFLRSLFLSEASPLVFTSILRGALREPELNVPPEEGLKPAHRIATVESFANAKGSLVKLPNCEIPLSTGLPADTPRLEHVARAISFFHIPTLVTLLSRAKNWLAVVLADTDAVADLRMVLRKVQPLYVEVFINNPSKHAFPLGRPARLLVRRRCWGKAPAAADLIRVNLDSGRSDSSVITAPEQTLTINGGGQGQAIPYLTTKNIAALESAYPAFVTEIYRGKCRLALRRADRPENQNGWREIAFKLRNPERATSK